MNINKEDLQKEFVFKTARSGGKGGQNVNKVETKVELTWDFIASNLFSDEQKVKIAKRLSNRINKENIFQLTAEENRTQLRNKDIAVNKAIYLISESLKEVKPRKSTKPSKSSIAKRLDGKRKQALKKINRKSDFND